MKMSQKVYLKKNVIKEKFAEDFKESCQFGSD